MIDSIESEEVRWGYEIKMGGKDMDIRKEIIKNYINKNKQERILWELNNPRKAEDAIWKLHHAQDLLKEDVIRPIQYMDSKKMKDYFHKVGATSEVYYIGHEDLGYIELDKAVKNASEGDVCIVYLGNGIAYYQGEEVPGGTPRYMLIAKNVGDKWK